MSDEHAAEVRDYLAVDELDVDEIDETPFPGHAHVVHAEGVTRLDLGYVPDVHFSCNAVDLLETQCVGSHHQDRPGFWRIEKGFA